MADITVTAANVAPVSGPQGVATAGEAIIQGKSISIDPADSKVYLYDANSATAARRRTDGVSLNSASIGQPLTYAADGAIIVAGATLAVGLVYVGSGTSGGIAPSADLVTGWYTSILGIAISATQLSLNIQNGGVAVP